MGKKTSEETVNIFENGSKLQVSHIALQFIFPRKSVIGSLFTMLVNVKLQTHSLSHYSDLYGMNFAKTILLFYFAYVIRHLFALSCRQRT